MINKSKTPDQYKIINIFNKFKPKLIPKSIKQIDNTDNPKEWHKALQSEIDSLISSGTFKKEPNNSFIDPTKIIPSQFIFDIRLNPDGTVKKYKARLVARGDLQSWDTFKQTYADTASSKSINILFSIAAQNNLDLCTIDITSAFLYSPLNEELYLKRPTGLTDNDIPLVVKLDKCLYGLKQAAHEWRQHLHNTLLSLNFIQNKADNCIYRLSIGDEYIIIATHVDDLLIASSNRNIFTSFHKQTKL